MSVLKIMSYTIQGWVYLNSNDFEDTNLKLEQ